MSIFNELKRKVMMMVANGIIEVVTNSGAPQQKAKLSLFAGELRENFDLFQDYGFTSRPLDGAEAVAVCVGGSRDNGLVIATEDSRYRVAVENGEVCIYTDEGDKVHFKRNNIIQVDCNTKLQINCPAVQITHPNGSGSPVLLQVDGNIVANGNIDASGNITDQDNTNNTNMANMRQIYNTHTHPETGSTTNAPSQPM